MTSRRDEFTASSRLLAVLDADGIVLRANPSLCHALNRVEDHVVGAIPDWAEHFECVTLPLPDGMTLLEVNPEAELVLRDNRRIISEMRAIIENTFEFIGLLSPDGCLLDANRTALAFIGLDTIRPVLGMHFADTPWWEHSDMERSALRDAIARAAAGEFVRFETTHVDALGGIAYVDFSLKPVRDASDDSVVFLVPEGRDITERKRMEAAMIAARQDAEAANQAKSRFLATVSHELRTPLNAVIGFSEAVLADSGVPATVERCVEYLDLIHSAGLHLQALIEDILDVSRIEAGRTELDEEDADPGELIRSAVRLLEHRAGAAGISLRTAIPGDLPRMRLDSRRIRQIILNLAGNALKFTPAPGTVTVSAQWSAEGVEIAVTDTGIGIAPEHQEKVWQAFYQADSSLARRHQGSGLGLAIVHHFTQAHGGSVSLTSAPGKGTRIGVQLPAARVLAQAARA